VAVVSEHFVVRLVPRAIVTVVALVALVPALLVIVGRGDVADTLGGDFPSFYGAGRIVLEGNGQDLYDPQTQLAAQAPYHDDPDELLYFAYPPFVAVAYAAIAWMPYGVALSMHNVLALAALGVALHLVVPRVTDRFTRTDVTLATTAVALAAYPIGTAALGGQNTTFTILLFAIVWRSLADVQPVRAGIAAAATLAKPQFGLVLAALLVVARRWSAVATAVAVGGGLAVVTAVGWGWDWAVTWLDQVQRFGDINDAVNGPLMINLAGWIPNVWDSQAADVVAFGAAAVVFGITAIFVWRNRLDGRSLGITTAAVLLVAPSALFYDLGLAIVGFGVLVLLTEPHTRRAGLIGLVVAVSWTQLAASALGWSPLFVVLVGLWCFAAWSESRRQVDEPAVA
jgi:hypothetical protein